MVIKDSCFFGQFYSFSLGSTFVAHSVLVLYIARSFGVAVDVNFTFASIRLLDLLMALFRFGLFLIDL
jgi:hypothetical protein